ncbi:MAG: NrfD/PsrC family molybdoenzyme membrane anchor subunit [Syntrophobacteraceae bacterium]|jgi:molybdopterin-containing oxidoreductase family membrane subunit
MGAIVSNGVSEAAGPQDLTTYGAVDDQILGAMWNPGGFYWRCVAITGLGVLVGAFSWGYQIATGLGMANITHPTMWGSYLVNFVFWVGIAHSGTLISAILFLFRASWRTTISRSSEAMTVFAVMIAGLFPLIHLGRVWLVYWIIPYPNQRNLWPNFQSPLVFDVVAVSTYLTVSFLFWYTGMVPDLATIRDRTAGIRNRIYGFFSLGWRGSSTSWKHYGTAYLLFAALATPLVISVHSVVSWDFALGIVPGWHSTIFAPYFVAGAIHSGLAMVLVLLIPMRKIFRFENLITIGVLENIGKTIILTGLIVGYSYMVEHFIAWYGGGKAEQAQYMWRMTGYYSWCFWLMIVCNAVVPIALFFKKVRTSIPALFSIGVLVLIGMWFERLVIIVGSEAHEYDPYSWGVYKYPSIVEWGILIGSFSLFFFLFLLFAKFLPTIAITEVKEAIPVPVRKK